MAFAAAASRPTLTAASSPVGRYGKRHAHDGHRRYPPHATASGHQSVGPSTRNGCAWRLRAIAPDMPPPHKEGRKDAPPKKDKNPCDKSDANCVPEYGEEDTTLPPSASRRRQSIDDELSNRWIDLDPAGYFLIRVEEDQHGGFISAAHYLNVIDADGMACDPHTGEVIPCDGSYKPRAHKLFRGRTAKELSVRILEEEEGAGTVTMLVHANYLGRELQRAESCMTEGRLYIQD